MVLPFPFLEARGQRYWTLVWCLSAQLSAHAWPSQVQAFTKDDFMSDSEDASDQTYIYTFFTLVVAAFLLSRVYKLQTGECCVRAGALTGCGWAQLIFQTRYSTSVKR